MEATGCTCDLPLPVQPCGMVNSLQGIPWLVPILDLGTSRHLPKSSASIWSSQTCQHIHWYRLLSFHLSTSQPYLCKEEESSALTHPPVMGSSCHGC